jgi:hypothetical protein
MLGTSMCRPPLSPHQCDNEGGDSGVAITTPPLLFVGSGGGSGSRQREWQAAAGSGEGRGDEREGVRRGWVGVTGSVGGHGGHGGICVPVRKYEP